MVAGGVTDSAVANETVSWEEIGVAHRGEKHLLGLRKQPFDGDVTEHWGHGFLQDLDHLTKAIKRMTEYNIKEYNLYIWLCMYVCLCI